jgi:hypothetical protein
MIYINARIRRTDILMYNLGIKICVKLLLLAAARSISVKGRRFWVAHVGKMLVMSRDV